MAEYIERGAAMLQIDNMTPKPNLIIVRERLAKIPTADVEEVRHGEWAIKSEIHQMFDDVDEEFYVECPLCKRTYYVPFELEEKKMLEYAKKNYPYCNCGAKMDGVPDTNVGKTDGKGEGDV